MLKHEMCQILFCANTFFFQFVHNLFIILGNIWNLEVNIPCDTDVNFRYFIASIDPSHPTDSVHVRRWESHLNTRKIPRGNEPQANADTDIFGSVNGIDKIDKGWLTNETILQFKFFNNPFMMKDRIKNRLLYVKVTITHNNKGHTLRLLSNETTLFS